MDNLSDKEDTGEEVKEIIGGDFTPDFKSRSTLQVWTVANASVTVHTWKGESLAQNSAHEIYITNNTQTADAVIQFSNTYELLDEDDELNVVTIPYNKTAHFYCAAVPKDGILKLIMRRGTQDTRG